MLLNQLYFPGLHVLEASIPRMYHNFIGIGYYINLTSPYMDHIYCLLGRYLVRLLLLCYLSTDSPEYPSFHYLVPSTGNRY